MPAASYDCISNWLGCGSLQPLSQFQQHFLCDGPMAFPFPIHSVMGAQKLRAPCHHTHLHTSQMTCVTKIFCSYAQKEDGLGLTDYAPVTEITTTFQKGCPFLTPSSSRWGFPCPHSPTNLSWFGFLHVVDIKHCRIFVCISLIMNEFKHLSICPSAFSINYLFASSAHFFLLGSCHSCWFVGIRCIF